MAFLIVHVNNFSSGVLEASHVDGNHFICFIYIASAAAFTMFGFSKADYCTIGKNRRFLHRVAKPTTEVLNMLTAPPLLKNSMAAHELTSTWVFYMLTSV